MADAVRHLVLVGLMGSGKSAVARRLGDRLGWPVADLDSVVETESGCTIAELFDREGEPGFRIRETRALEHALSATTPSVIATGGGVVVRQENRDRLRHAAQSRVVWLDTDLDTLSTRLGLNRLGSTQAGSGVRNRPLLADDPSGVLERLDEERRPWYQQVAHHRIDTTVCSIDEVVERIATYLAESSAGREVEP